MRRVLFILLLTISLLIPSQADALSRAFNDREVITYQLYFNWKFVWIKAGTATMTTQPSTYKGKNVFRTSLVTQTSRKIDRFFVMRDTITSFCDLTSRPYIIGKARARASAITSMRCGTPTAATRPWPPCVTWLPTAK